VEFRDFALSINQTKVARFAKDLTEGKIIPPCGLCRLHGKRDGMETDRERGKAFDFYKDLCPIRTFRCPAALDAFFECSIRTLSDWDFRGGGRFENHGLDAKDRSEEDPCRDEAEGVTTDSSGR
jgi:hypothetical protein